MTTENQSQPDRETSSSASAPAAWSWQKFVVFLRVLLLFYAIEGLVLLLSVTPRFLSAQRLKGSVWIVLYEQHFWQLVLALVCIGFFSRGRFAEWGFNLRSVGVTWRIFWKFCLVYSAIIFFVNVLPALRAHEPPTFDYPMTRENIVGWLTFEWIFVGISEEIMFRGLIHTYLARSWRGVWHIGKLAFPTAGWEQPSSFVWLMWTFCTCT